jgi:hypothetical protein
VEFARIQRELITLTWLNWLKARAASAALVGLAIVVSTGSPTGLPKSEVDRSDVIRVASSLPSTRTATGAELLLDGLYMYRGQPPEPQYVSENGEVVDVKQVAHFLESQSSPMAPHASDIVKAGSTYGVDPRLVIAIAGVESSFGRHCRGHNAWGWNNGRTRWKSWSESIDTYTRLFSERYPNWRNLSRIAPVYNPNTPEQWGRKVSSLIASIRTASV